MITPSMITNVSCMSFNAFESTANRFHAASLEDLLGLHVHKSRVHPPCVLLVRRNPLNLLRRIVQSDDVHSYPETKNLTLEEIDYLFIKDGKKGLKQFTTRSQPVLESLKPVEEIEADVEKQAERRSSGDVDHVEGKDEKKDD